MASCYSIFTVVASWYGTKLTTLPSNGGVADVLCCNGDGTIGHRLNRRYIALRHLQQYFCNPVVWRMVAEHELSHGCAAGRRSQR